MGKHSGQPDKGEMTPRERDQIDVVPSEDRLDRDVAIVDNGWNNTPEDRR